jgi:biopolymer transport protein TolQ
MEPAQTISLDPVALVTHASIPVRLTAAVLVLASTAVWAIAVVKFLQIARLRAAEGAFSRDARGAIGQSELFAIASGHRDAPGARVVLELAARPGGIGIERLKAASERAIVTERERAGSLLSPLGSIASAAPFVGLFGTVYGIMDAFMRIGAEKSASLPVVAPAIGEALITTAIGLAAAIPAVVLYNALDKRVSDLLAEVEASAGEWVAMLAADGSGPTPARRSSRPPAAAEAAAWGGANR